MNQQNIDHIQITHIGSLPRPHDLLDQIRAKYTGQSYDRAGFDSTLTRSVQDSVRQQAACGIDFVTDGEFSKPGFFSYIQARLDGFEPRNERFPMFEKEIAAFPEYYEAYFKAAMLGGAAVPMVPMACVGPVKYKGEALLKTDIANLKAAAERGRTTAFLANFEREFSSLGVQLGARYDHSEIIGADRDVAPPDHDLTYVPSSVPGGRTPHFWLDDRRDNGSSLFDRLGRGFTLLCFSKKSSEVAPFISSARARGVPLTTVMVENDSARDLYERDMILIRPDQYVAWRGNSAPQDCDALMMRITGWL